MINKIHNEGCRGTLDKLDQDIDLTITSPPYNVDLGNNKFNDHGYDLYNDNRDHQEYIRWMADIFSKVKKNTSFGGRCVINVGDGKNGKIPTHSDIIQIMTDMDWVLLGTIIWNKSQIANRCAWGSFKSPNCPSFPTPFEYILLFGNEHKKLQKNGETDIEKQEFIDWSLPIWEFKPETNAQEIGHPAPFPEELPKRCIKMLSWKDSLVYDPFAGSGTTLKVANDLDRDYIGSEISSDYCDIARERINK